VGLLFLAVNLCFAADHSMGPLLPDGSEFVSWEKPLRFTRTYYVDNRNPHSSDANAGTQDSPFLTINRAAQAVQPGERVVISSGVYRESIVPIRGGTGPDTMISYEAAPGATVIVKGSKLVKTGWQPSSGFQPSAAAGKSMLYQFRMEQLALEGYNPFGLLNVLKERSYEELGKAPQGMRPVLMTRGMVFVDGKPLRQADTYEELSKVPGTFWPEQDGMVVHVHLVDESDPARHDVEFVTQQHVFAPRERYLGYIRIKGITFEHGADGFPRPQDGMVSTNRGNHWIIEDSTFRHANAVALDIGNQSSWARPAPEIGYMIVRRNHIYDAGICGIAGPEMHGTLIEDNLIEDIGGQDAESLWESAGIKLHILRDSVVRRNILRHFKHAAGIWLDWDNVNSRVTGNVIGDIETLNVGIFVEASLQPNTVDHNIVFDVRDAPIGREKGIQREGGNCIATAGTDETIIAHNLLARCQQAAVSVVTEDWRKRKVDRIRQ
jgi:Right handed beta helix region